MQKCMCEARVLSMCGKKRSGNIDLKALCGLTKGKKIYTVNLEALIKGVPEFGEEAESIVTNSQCLASAIERAACMSRRDVEEVVEKM